MKKEVILQWGKNLWFWLGVGLLVFTIWFDLWHKVDWWVGFLLWWAIFFSIVRPSIKMKFNG